MEGAVILNLAFVIGGVWILADMVKLIRYFRAQTDDELSMGEKATTLGLIVVGTFAGSVIAYFGLTGLIA